MNRERIEKLRDFLRDDVPDERFDMSDYLVPSARSRSNPYQKTVGAALKSCGTAACIAGWAQYLFEPRRRWSFEIGRDSLGLTDHEAKKLFLPIHLESLSDIPRARAVATLTHLLETGEVDWCAL